MIGKVGLQYDFAGRLAASGASRYLRQQLEGSLSRTKIGQTQRDIRAHHTHERDAVHVVSLGNHLRAHQQIKLALVERVEHALEILIPAHRIAIEPPDPCRREHAVQQLFELLRTGSEKIHVLTSTLSAS